MNHEITIPGETPCECGNALTQGQTRCAKCVARSRWARKERARNRRNRSSETRRSPRGPRASAVMGVSWT